MRKNFGILLAIVFGLPLAFLALVPFYTGRIEQQASDTWRQAGLPFEDFAARYPRAAENDSAKRLRELTAPLGITFPDAKGGSSTLAVQQELLAHLKARLDGQQVPVPAALQSFREQHAAALDALLGHLASAEPPRWELDMSRDFSAPIPALVPQRQTGQLLLLEALERPAEAERGLLALWNLTATLRDRPDLVSVLVAAAIDRQTLALARRLESVPPAIAEKLATLQQGGRLPRLWQTEAWTLWHYAQRDGRLSPLGEDSPEEGGLVGRLSAPFERRLLRLCAADSSRVLATAAVEAQAQAPCSAPNSEAMQGRLARWNIVGKIALPAVEKIWSVLLALQLDAELTQKVLAVRAQRGPDGAWPAEFSDLGSKVCPGSSWRYTREADGKPSLAWTGSEPKADLAQLTFSAAAR